MRLLVGFLSGLAISGTLTYQYGTQWSAQLHQLGQRPTEQTVEQSAASPAPAAETAVHIHPPVSPEQVTGDIGPVLAAMPVDQPEDDTEAAWAEFMAGSDRLSASGEFPWGDCFRRAAATYNVPELLLLSVARGESGFDATARSHRDAVGIMQIRWPQTAAHLGILSERQLYEPCLNIDAGARYLRELLQRYQGNAHLALAAYNFGPGRVSAEHVPQLASQYSSYILQQLDAVLGKPVTASTPSAETGRMLLLDFTQPHRARAMLEFLRESEPELRLSIGPSPRGTHAVYLAYADRTEQQRALRAIDATGITIAMAGVPRPNQEGIAHDL